MQKLWGWHETLGGWLPGGRGVKGRKVNYIDCVWEGWCLKEQGWVGGRRLPSLGVDGAVSMLRTLTEVVK